MIIINQDRTVILNYENIEAIGVAKSTKDRFKIIAATVTNSEIEIAQYKTEERAKEVLNEIKEKYTEYAKISNVSGDIRQVFILPKVYEMPKE